MRILVTIVVILIATAAIWLGVVLWPEEQAPATVAPPVDTNAPVSTPPVTKGDIPVGQSVTYRETMFTVETALRASTFRRTQVAEGSEFMVLFFKPFTTDPPSSPSSWAGEEITIRPTGGQSILPTEVSMPNRANVGGGYLWFTVPAGSNEFDLIFGRSADATIHLSF